MKLLTQYNNRKADSWVYEHPTGQHSGRLYSPKCDMVDLEGLTRMVKMTWRLDTLKHDLVVDLNL